MELEVESIGGGIGGMNLLLMDRLGVRRCRGCTGRCDIDDSDDIAVTAPDNPDLALSGCNSSSGEGDRMPCQGDVRLNLLSGRNGVESGKTGRCLE
jgi:hypothetical protein